MKKKIGRNDKCPCGSGNKYKKCCIDKERIALKEKEIQDKLQEFIKKDTLYRDAKEEENTDKETLDKLKGFIYKKVAYPTPEEIKHALEDPDHKLMDPQDIFKLETPEKIKQARKDHQDFFIEYSEKTTFDKTDFTFEEVCSDININSNDDGELYTNKGYVYRYPGKHGDISEWTFFKELVRQNTLRRSEEIGNFDKEMYRDIFSKKTRFYDFDKHQFRPIEEHQLFNELVDQDGKIPPLQSSLDHEEAVLRGEEERFSLG